MKSSAARSGILSTLTIIFWGVSTTPEIQAQWPQTNGSGYVTAERSAHETRWQRLEWRTNQLGEAVARTNEFVELATGLNFVDEATQTLQPSREEWQVYPDAIVAQAGRHRVILGHNLNLGGCVDVLAPDGVRLVSNPVGLGFYDPVDGRHQMLAEIKDCAPQWGATTNEIVFRDCFEGMRGSIRFLYTRAGICQEVVLEQRLQLPAGFSDKSRLECYTEFAPSTPWPSIETRVLRREKDPILRAQMVEPDFTDSRLGFGEMAMGSGLAFSLGDPAEAQSIRVGKRFEVIGARPVLTESVEFKQLESLLARLAAVERPKAGLYAVNSSRQIKGAKQQAGLPREPLRALGAQKEIQLASNPLKQPAVIIDYELLSSATNFTLKGDTTWFVSGLVNLSGTTTIEGGSVVKFTNSSSAKININGAIDCRTAAYRPAIFTSKNQNSVGETIPGSTGNASNYPTALVISTAGTVLHDLRFSYATNGVTLDFAAGQISLTNVQFVNCQYPIDSSVNDENSIILDNGLIHFAKYGIKGGRDLIVRGQHVTAHNCERFAYSPSGGDSYAYLTNCLLVGVTNWGSDFTFTTNSVAYYATDVAGIFQTVGAGAHYLANSSTNRDAGTPNISASLLAVLTNKTTYPPIVFSNLTVSVTTNLFPRAPRDTNNAPDRGFAYSPIDYLTHWFNVTNATLTLSNGVVLACYNDTGVWMSDRSAIVSVGTPLAPNWFTRYSLVQEQSTALGSDVGLDVNSYHYSTNAPNGTFQYTKFTCPPGTGYHLYHSGDYAFTNLTVRDCEFWNGLSYFGGSSSIGGSTRLNNNLFYRSQPWAYNSSSQQSLAVSNNLVYGAYAALYGPASDLWKVYDNAFDTCSFLLPFHLITNGYNAYINCSNRLSPNSAYDIVLTNLAWQSGFLGNFYQPTNSPLINTGSLTSAALAGLYHYTTTTNQVKEASTTLDRGYHYVAVSNGLPVDTDGDSQADYFEDTNGNGIFDTGAEKVDRPDAMGAVGPNHYMAVLNYVVKAYDKSTGQPIVTNSLNDFMRVTIPSGQAYEGTYPASGDHTGDPRVIFDHLSQRWFACAIVQASTNRHILLAISKTSDPVGDGGAGWVSNNWVHYLVPTGLVPTNNYDIDQPKLAVDSNGIYITSYATRKTGTPHDALRVVAFPKVSFLDATNTPNTAQTNFIFDCPSNHHSQPAVNFEPIATNDPLWLIDVNVFGTNLYYNQLKWTNGFASKPGLVMTNWGQLAVSQSYVNTLNSSDAPQTNSSVKIDLLDSRLMMATMSTLSGTQYLSTCHHVWVNQYGTNGTPAADRSGIQWFKVQLTPSVNIAETGRIFDSAASNPKFYYYPSLAINRNGDMMIGFSGSSVNDYMGAHYWGRLHNGTSLSTPIRYFAGKDWLDNEGGTASGGDYSYTTLDPVDGLTFWTIQQYAETRTSGLPGETFTWGTRIAAVRPY